MKKVYWRSFDIYGRECKAYKVKWLIRDHGAYGEFKPYSFEILIDDALEGDVLVSTVGHELFHAAAERLLFDVSDEKEERIATLFDDLIGKYFELTN